MQGIRTDREVVVYENSFVTAYDNEVSFPSGDRGRYFRVRWKFPHGVGVVPFVGDRILLIDNFRYSELERSVEIPQGFGTVPGAQEDDARRELLEETGALAGALRPLLVTGGDFKNHVYATELQDDFVPHDRHAEATEAIKGYRFLPVAEATPSHLAAMAVIDTLSIAAILAAVAERRASA